MYFCHLQSLQQKCCCCCPAALLLQTLDLRNIRRNYEKGTVAKCGTDLGVSGGSSGGAAACCCVQFRAVNEHSRSFTVPKEDPPGTVKIVKILKAAHRLWSLWKITTTTMFNRDKLIWQKLEFIYCHKNLGLNDQDRKIYGIICYCCHIGNYPPWQLWRVKQLIIYLYLNSNCATFPT